MYTKKTIEDFFSQPAIAVVGVSRSGKKFGDIAFKELKTKGYNVFPVHPKTESINGEKCFSDFKSVPSKISAAVISIKPVHVLKILQDAAETGIRYVWLQQGAESKEAIDFCSQSGINVIHNECVMMFASPVKSVHRVHRWIWGLFGKLPK